MILSKRDFVYKTVWVLTYEATLRNKADSISFQREDDYHMCISSNHHSDNAGLHAHSRPVTVHCRGTVSYLA